ncbi:unnamed protein product [Penicillium roqueforti FM164]|uniref:Genomic scaffold, ProqFM164S03 n=1 Tax=Penicillium roqueforti (strain FM164) TaxID=1365484 RepID=W6QGN2_PENRF|nr:unnamed protein product [Penicillium roqueforti FM164]
MRGRSCIINHRRLPKWESVFVTGSSAGIWDWDSAHTPPSWETHASRKGCCLGWRILFQKALNGWTERPGHIFILYPLRTM